MKKLIYNMSFCFLIMLFLSPIGFQNMFAQTDIPTGDVSGTWTKAYSPYHINGEITIPNESTLTIEPGVEVVFTGHYKFNVQGRLLAIGTETDTIVFTINDTTGFHNVTIPDGGWGGIRLSDMGSSNDSTIIEYCSFQYGKSANGGAIYSEIDKLRISHCLFRNNVCFRTEPMSGTGGAIYICGGKPLIEYSEFCLNKSACDGSALSILSSSDALIRNNHFHHNIGTGPISIYNSDSPIFINNLIEQNYSNSQFIIYFSTHEGNAKIINNTIVNNTCSLGAVLVNAGLVLFVNNIVYGNEPSQVYFDSPSSVSFKNCLIEGGKEGFRSGGSNFTGEYENCIDVDPLFVSSDDYHLQDNSPCIGAAIDSILISNTMHYCPPTDFEGNPRPNPSGSMPDIGAFENALQNPSDIPAWITYNTSNSGLPENRVLSIAIDGSGNKWIAVAREIGDLYYLVKYDGNNWTVYNRPNKILCLAIDEFNSIWIGTWLGGLAKFDGMNWTVYNTSNSGLPDNTVRSIAIDGSGNKWIGTYDSGLAKFDGTNWTVYNTSNSGLPENEVLSIAIDGSGNKWIGAAGNFVKFDDNTWTVYDTPGPSYGGAISCITIDNAGDKWIGASILHLFSWGGLYKFDDETFTYYAESDSGVPLRGIPCIAIDEFDNKWIGISESGLAKFDGTNWTVFNTSNSDLPNNGVNSLAIDGGGNKWIGTYRGGLAVYKEDGVVSVEENLTIKEIIPNEYLLYQNYPNPFNPTTTINYSILKQSNVIIKVFDVLGREVDVLVNKEQTIGNHEVEFDASSLTSGIYFYQLTAGAFVETKKLILLK